MAKCDACKNEIKETLIGKIKGTFVRKNKKVFKLCSDCQKSYKMDELKKRLN